MFEQVEAIRFDRKMSSGRTSPLLLECELPDGSNVEVVAKFSKGCSIGGLIREATMAMLASDLGLPVPAPYLVHLSAEFVDAIPDTAITSFLRDGDTFGFGSKRLPDGYGQWITSEGRMADSLEQQATEIMAFDCWCTNPDRRVSNPNLLTNGRQFAIFDHELALLGQSTLFWRAPWQPDGLMNTKPPVEHVFFDHLRGRATYRTDDVRALLSHVSNARFNEYLAALPPSWVATGSTASDAVGYIMSLRDNSSGADTELKRSLT